MFTENALEPLKWISLEENLSIAFVLTADGSVSLRLNALDYKILSNELMHSDSGAFSETIYVYLPVLDNLIKENKNLFLTSIGLGAGYVEIMSLSYIFKLLKLEHKKIEYKIVAFEKVNVLRNFFISFFMEEEKDLPIVFKDLYSSILLKFSNYFQLDMKELKLFIKKSLIEGLLSVESDFNTNTILAEKINGIFFDAFSPKTSPDLWNVETINHLIANNINNDVCYFASYAANGIIKKCLKNNGYILLKRKGFSGKRESILARR